MRWTVFCIVVQLPLVLRADNLFPYINYSVKPCDDFYNFACGNFETVHPIPPTYKTWNEFVRLQKEIDERLKELLERGKSRSDTRAFMKARKMYASCMDIKIRNEKGVLPIRKVLAGWPTRYNIKNKATKITSTDWDKMANFVANYGVQFIFNFKIRADLFDATRTSIYIESDDLTLPTSLLKESARILDNDFSSRTDSTLIQYLTRIMTVLRDTNGGDIEDDEILTVARSINEFMIGLNDILLYNALDNEEDTATVHTIPNIGSITLAQLNAWSNEVLANFADPWSLVTPTFLSNYTAIRTAITDENLQAYI